MVEQVASANRDADPAKERPSHAGGLLVRVGRRIARGAAARAASRSASSRSGPAPRRGRWKSPLTRRILTVNVLAMLIPILGLLHLDQYRQSLITSELLALETQGKAFALSLGSTAASTGQNAEERLLPDQTRQLMRVLLSGSGIRARVFSLDGQRIADSFLLMAAGGQVQVIELPAPDDGSAVAVLGRVYQQVVNWMPGIGDLPLYEEPAGQTALDYPEVGRAMAGENRGMVRIDRAGHLMLTMAVPVQRYRKVLGALMLSKDGGEIDALVQDRRSDILIVFGLAIGFTVLLSFYLAGTLARPIRRLAEAADRVRHGKGREFEIPDFTGRGDEIGDLSGALREMTMALRSRLDAIEGFAADVAHEIKNPLTSLRSAVETVSRVEDPEQQKKLMSIILDDVERLDRLISDISDASRLDAELSRSESETVQVDKLLEALVEVHKATVGADGPGFEVDLADGRGLRVSGLEGRLGQVFRNLISNAISFSPEGGVIRLEAHRLDPGSIWSGNWASSWGSGGGRGVAQRDGVRDSQGEGRWIEIVVADDGPGLPEGKLDAVFDRFYSERPRSEKFGTHSGLGLSISRQIVEAHGGTIRAENRLDASGEVVGARFVVRLPAE